MDLLTFLIQEDILDKFMNNWIIKMKKELITHHAASAYQFPIDFLGAFDWSASKEYGDYWFQYSRKFKGLNNKT